jgi:hypothetical protein
MNDDPPPPRQGWGCLQWGAVLICLLLVVSLLDPFTHGTNQMASQTSAANNCRQILMAFKIWAEDEGGVYPDARLPATATANEVFRTLISDEVIQDERIFGARHTPFMPDGDVGTVPGFPRALQPGENHWMMMAGLPMNSPAAASLPFVFENTLTPSWPLTWRLDQQNEPVRGRVWRKNSIIVGRLDLSVNVEKLVRENGALVLPPLLREAAEKQFKGPPRVLDIEEKK